MSEKQVSSIEIQMHAFRLMRSGKFQQAASLRSAVLEDFPAIPTEVVDRALSTLARRLGEANE